MTPDYTLVVPTYNRSRLLGTLLRFLEAEEADFPVIVLDSSNAQHRERNRRLLAGCRLEVQHVEYPEDTHPFDKFRDGVERIRTALGSLCADDDLVLLSGLRRCIDHLRTNPEVAVAHGYYFTFLEQGAADFDITTMLYFTPSIEDDEPLARIRSLLRSYQALTYGVYRTPILRLVMASVRSFESLFARELLSGTLSVVHGKVARLRVFYGGRSHNPSEVRRHWHPLEWLITDPPGFLEEYVRYRERLLEALAAVPGNSYSPAETERLVDLMHAFYVIAHAPRESHDFILDHAMAGHELEKFWADPAIQQPLVGAHYGAHPEVTATEARRAWLPSRALRLARRMGVLGARSEAGGEVWPRTARRKIREYRMHRNFLAFEPRALRFATPEDIERLLDSLDHYRAVE